MCYNSSCSHIYHPPPPSMNPSNTPSQSKNFPKETKSISDFHADTSDSSVLRKPSHPSYGVCRGSRRISVSELLMTELSTVNIYYFFKLKYLSHSQNLGKVKTSLGLLHICLFINFWLSGVPPQKDSNQVYKNTL